MPSLQNLLACDELKTVPFLILGNKIDIARAASEQELRDSLGLHQTTGKVSLPSLLFLLHAPATPLPFPTLTLLNRARPY